jgi:hypothetical protein
VFMYECMKHGDGGVVMEVTVTVTIRITSISNRVSSLALNNILVCFGI